MNRSFDDRQYLNEELKDMFFSLDLIESYGSGIRRAKDAMELNHSPSLKFLPDNDIDDYTMAVAYINEEFAKIRDEEKFSGSDNKTSTGSRVRKYESVNINRSTVRLCERKRVSVIKGYCSTIGLRWIGIYDVQRLV